MDWNGCPKILGISVRIRRNTHLNEDEITAMSISLSSLDVPFMLEPNNNTFSTDILFSFNRAIYSFIRLIIEDLEEAIFLTPQFV